QLRPAAALAGEAFVRLLPPAPVTTPRHRQSRLNAPNGFFTSGRCRIEFEDPGGRAAEEVIGSRAAQGFQIGTHYLSISMPIFIPEFRTKNSSARATAQQPNCRIRQGRSCEIAFR